VLLGFSARAVFLCAVLCIAGCSTSEPPQFLLNIEGRDAEEVSPVQRKTVAELLKRFFGTPDEPVVPPESELQLDLLQTAAGSIGSDQLGKMWGLFRQHCVTCHGISGDGVGPTASLLNPYPRDFRTGVFKYTSTTSGAKPLVEDLMRTLVCGIPGTAMPSFATLPEQEIEALIEYVKYLSLRGETELFLLQLVVDEDEYSPYPDEVLEDGLEPVVGLWAMAPDMAVDREEAEQLAPPIDTPEALAASIARGFELYASEDAKCAECHGPNGEGDGESAELYDDWNKGKQGATPEQTKALADRFRLPSQQLLPRDFTEGTFLGGDRPIDLYWRIHVGIKGTPMPPAGPALGNDGILTPAEIWAVVNYVRSRAEGKGK